MKRERREEGGRRRRGEGEGFSAGLLSEEDGLALCLRTSDLLLIAEHFFDVLQAQQAQLAEGGAAGLSGIESD